MQAIKPSERLPGNDDKRLIVMSDRQLLQFHNNPVLYPVTQMLLTDMRLIRHKSIGFTHAVLKPRLDRR